MVTTRLRLLSLLTAAIVVFGACSNSATPSGSAAAGGSSGASECAGTGADGSKADLQIPDVVAGKFNVAMVLIGPHNDNGWSQAHYEGLQYLCQNMPGSHIAYIELVPEGADSEQVFRSLSRKGFNFIIGTSFGYMDYMETVAKEFPDITYLHLTGRPDLPQLDQAEVDEERANGADDPCRVDTADLIGYRACVESR